MFCSILFDCAVNERVDILQLLIDLAKIAICDNLEGSSVAFDLWQIKFALSMCEKFKSLKTDVVDAINYLTENKIKGNWFVYDQIRFCYFGLIDFDIF